MRSRSSFCSTIRSGLGALASFSVSSSEMLSPLEFDGLHSSSSALIDELAICSSAPRKSSMLISSSPASSSSVGTRCSFASSLTLARSIWRARARTERGTQSRAGNPAPIRPATYLTSGEYATTSRSRAFWSSEVLKRRHRSRSSTAFTFVCTEVSRILLTELRSRVTAGVGASQSRGLYLSVDLRSRNARVPEQLLDRPQVGAAVQQMGCEGVTEGVRMHRAAQPGPRRPDPQSTADIRGRQRATGFRQQQRRLLVVGERRASALQVALQRAQRRLPDRHQAGLRTLALDPHLLGIEVHRVDRQPDQLLGAQARGVGQLEHRSITQFERCGGAY